MRILSIDAWNGPDGWSWNNWHEIGTVDKKDFEELKTNRQILKWFRDEGYLTEESKGKCSIDDDQHNIVIRQRSNAMPLLAIEYGPEYQ